MIKLVVVLVSVGLVASAPAPGLYHGGLAATSYSSRVDIHTPVIKTAVVAPVVTKVVTPLHYSPYHISGYGYGLGHEYDNGLHGFHHLGYGGHSLGHGYHLGHDLGYGLGHGYGHGW